MKEAEVCCDPWGPPVCRWAAIPAFGPVAGRNLKFCFISSRFFLSSDFFLLTVTFTGHHKLVALLPHQLTAHRPGHSLWTPSTFI